MTTTQRKVLRVNLSLSSGWRVIQDVHDSGEALRIFDGTHDHTEVGPQISEWEPIDRLEHLQVIFSDHPYWGRELRYFNQAPWWYLNEFEIEDAGERAVLRFSNADYFAKVWLNGVYLGAHEGYSNPFSFDVSDIIRVGGMNALYVKVWSPWDTEVYDDLHDMRTSRIVRDLVKGTYEHGDTLIARDVNPVGIYGDVTLQISRGVGFATRPVIDYELSDDFSAAHVTVDVSLVGEGPRFVEVEIAEIASGRIVAHTSCDFTGGDDAVRCGLRLERPRLWNTWDRGGANLYRVTTRVGSERHTTRIGFRSIDLLRTQERTMLSLNGHPLYVRGTSYFPDVYMSTMSRERYIRDLTAIRQAGFNLIRVHVHVELPEFYDLADEFGLAVMQDSEFNWTHPDTTEWAQRISAVFVDTVTHLRDHPSIVTWIALNEPGVLDGTDRTGGYAMSHAPGPQIYAAIAEADPTRPIIMGSFCYADPLSGDSHNYVGSLDGPEVSFIAIDGTTEKLNTEFGFDAPGSELNLRTQPAIARRLTGVWDRLPEIRDYQYRLTKYYIEHYRAQKGEPNWGYVQFMFIDLSPQSFYGVYDWWGTPKTSLAALDESNGPVAVLLERTAHQIEGVLVINDTLDVLGPVTVAWSVTDGDVAISDGEETAVVGAGEKIRVAALNLASDELADPSITLVARASDGRVIARNVYDRVFAHPAHILGHPSRMSHELGMRIYSA